MFIYQKIFTQLFVFLSKNESAETTNGTQDILNMFAPQNLIYFFLYIYIIGIVYCLNL